MKYAGAYIDQTKHEKLNRIAKKGNRSLSGFCRHLYDGVLNGTIEVPDCKAPARKGRKCVEAA